MIVDLKSKLPFDSEQEADSFSLVVRNTTTSTVYANILGATTNLKDNANATISYSYNLAGETFATNSITIQYKTTTQPTFQTATLPLNQQNIEGVVFALNQLGIGTWFYSGNDVITYNNTYEFGTLDITAVVPPVTFAGQLNTVFTTNGGTGLSVTNVRGIVQQPDGKFVVAGGFTSFGAQSAQYIIRLTATGGYDITFNSALGFNGTVEKIALQTDGKIIAVGNFTSYAGNPSSYIARINTNGSFDATFNIGTGLSGVANDVVIQTDGKIIVAGNFSQFNGNPSDGIVRINTNGSYDATFNVGLGTGAGIGNALGIQTDGKIILCGGFSNYNGIPANGIVRINTNGSYDGTFNTAVGANNTVLALAIQSDGKIIIGGTFTTYNGSPTNYIVRLNTNASFDGTFTTLAGFDGGVQAIIIQSNGKIIAAGSFNTYQGFTASKIVRMDTSGIYDPTFITGTGFNLFCDTLSYDSTNNIVTVGGIFNQYDGFTTPAIAQIYTVSPA